MIIGLENPYHSFSEKSERNRRVSMQIRFEESYNLVLVGTAFAKETHYPLARVWGRSATAD